MSHLLSTLDSTRSWISENPAQFATTSVFLLAFGWFASNALTGQEGQHAAPLWTSSIERSTVEAIPQPAVARNLGALPTHTVLTQRISLRNIPVPTVSPLKRHRPAAHSTLVREVQSALSGGGLYAGKVDGIFGDATRRAILDYQEAAGLIPDGEASYGLLAHIKSAFAVAQVKQRSSASTRPAQPELIVLDPGTVQAVQAGLRDFYGTDEIAVDGIFGNQTRRALKRFQERFSLKATGELDSATLRKLREAGIVDAT